MFKQFVCVCECVSVFDSGSTISLINSRLLKLDRNKINKKRTVYLKSINGVNKNNEITKLKVKIMKIEKEVNVCIVDSVNFTYDFLIGLDCIKKF